MGLLRKSPIHKTCFMISSKDILQIQKSSYAEDQKWQRNLYFRRKSLQLEYLPIWIEIYILGENHDS